MATPKTTAEPPANSIYFNINDPLSVVAFSTGQVIGSGQSTVETINPEPFTLSTFGLGLTGLVIWRRRRRA